MYQAYDNIIKVFVNIKITFFKLVFIICIFHNENKGTKGFFMKKIAVLTSLLALTACGGGSHHAGDRVRVSEQPTYEQPYLLTSEETRLSNSQITNMVSEVAVCKNCSSPRKPEARYSGEKEYEGKKFEIYDLSDVKFTMSDEGALEPGEESFYFVIDETDNAGKIIGVNLADKSKEHSWRESDKDHPEHNKTKDVDADLVRTEDNALRCSDEV